MFVIGNRRLGRRFAKLAADRRTVSFIGGPVVHRGDAVHLAVEPDLDAISATTQRRAADEIAAAIGNGRFCEGLAAALVAAEQRRVELLVVEEGFTVGAETASPGKVDDQVAASDSLDDVVDELIESVLDGGGRVQPVADGMLHRWGRVAARLSY